MKNRLTKLLSNFKESKINGLLLLVENIPPDSDLSKRDKPFRMFARELETVFEQSYRQRRAASEESLLKVVLEALTVEDIADWQSWWAKVDEVLTNLNVACGLSRMALFVGSGIERPFEMEMMAAHQKETWGRAKINVGPYWQVIRHKPFPVTDQTWSKSFREFLSIRSDEPCVVTSFTCKAGTPANVVPGVLVWVGKEVETQGMVEFLGKLANEISRAVTMVCNILEVRDVRQKASAAAAYGAHDVKFPLHVAFQQAEKIRHAFIRLRINDPGLIADADDLITALQETKNRARPLEKLPLREIKIQCVFRDLDIIPLIDRAISFAKALGEDRGISVKWVERPSRPVRISIDKAYLSTAVHAIFDNAVKYSFSSKEVRIFGNVEGAWFVLRISDFGVGIPPEKEFSLFEFGKRAEIEDEYKGRQRGGKGLGLAIAHRIIKAHGGDLYLETVPSKGTLSQDDYLSCEVSAYIRLPLQ